MKLQNNIKIILTPVGSSNRGDLENIENNKYSSKRTLAKTLKIICGEAVAKVLTVEEFSKELAFSPARKPFLLALSNIRKRNQCYKLTDFMDEFNNQDFGGETDKYWLGYVKIK